MKRIPAMLVASIMLLATSAVAASLDGAERRVRHELVMLP